jgi:predicted esterase
MNVTIHIEQGAELRYDIPLTHHSKPASNHEPSRTHYLQTHRHPVLSSSIIIPPVSYPEEIGHQYPAVLALHGAGVDFRSPMWTTAISRQEHSWIVCPSGLSYWGYDWHGPSAADAIAALNALISREPGVSSRPIVIGHSNGGQGTVHLCQHYPDLVLGAIPVAQYLTPSAYVPLSGSHGEHYVDPALSAILRASTANGDNDLFLSNLTEMKVRIFHGGADENVPVWQSRKVMETIKLHSHPADVT